MKCIGVVLSITATFVDAGALDVDESDTNLVIIGSRLETDINQEPANIQVITAEQIKRSGASSFAEILRGIGSIQVSDNSTNTTLSLRGFSAEQAANNTLILLNGRRLNNSDIAAPQLTNISIEDIQRIEILNSSAGVLYGDQAVGGVVNIITRNKSDSEYSEASLSIGNFDSRKLAFSGQYQLQPELSFGFSVRDHHSDNYRQHNEQQLQQQTINLSYDNDIAGVTLLIENRQLDINTPGALLESDVSLNRASSRAEFSEDFLDTASRNYQISSYWNIKDNWLLEADIQHNKDDNVSLTSFINFQNTAQSKTRRLQNSFTPRLRVSLQNDYSKTDITTGVDVNRASYNFELLGRSNIQELVSGYIFVSAAVRKELTLSGGARYSKVKDKLSDALTYPSGVNLSNDASTFNLGAIYTVSERYRLFLRVEDNFRFAKVDEQAFTPPDIFGLKPQTGISYDLGLSSLQNNKKLPFDWKLSFFHLKLKDEIIFDPTATAPAGSFFQGANVNSERSERDGLLVNASQQFAEDFQVNLNTSWTDARFTTGANASKAIPGVAKVTARLDLNYSVNEDANTTLEWHYKGKRKQEGDVSGFFAPLKPYSIVNFAFYQKFKDWQISVRVNNIFNKEYNGFVQFNGFYPAAERNAQLTIRYALTQ